MSIYSERVLPEIESTVVSAISLTSTAVVTRATKWIRFDWRQLISYFEDNVATQGLEPPWVIIRIGPEEEAEWGMAVAAYTVPVEIFLIQSERNYVRTTITTGVTSKTHTVASTTGMFIGQRLLLEDHQVFGIVESIPSATSVILVDSTTSTTGEVLSSDIGSDVHVRAEQLRNVFKRGDSFTNFQIMEDPVIDVSDINPVNDAMGHDNYNLFAGSVFIKLLVGEIL